MRSVILLLLLGLTASSVFAQRDTTRKPTAPAAVQPMVPGVESPRSAPGTMMQSSAHPATQVQPEQTGRKRRSRTAPPADPRAFGVAVPLGKPKADTLKKD